MTTYRQPDIRTVRFPVRVRELTPGDPPALALARVLTRTDGKQKVHFGRVAITDRDLFRRLCAGVKPGDEIVVAITTDWSHPRLPKYLADFSPAPSGAAGFPTGR